MGVFCASPMMLIICWLSIQGQGGNSKDSVMKGCVCMNREERSNSSWLIHVPPMIYKYLNNIRIPHLPPPFCLDHWSLITVFEDVVCVQQFATAKMQDRFQSSKDDWSVLVKGAGQESLVPSGRWGAKHLMKPWWVHQCVSRLLIPRLMWMQTWIWMLINENENETFNEDGDANNNVTMMAMVMMIMVMAMGQCT